MKILIKVLVICILTIIKCQHILSSETKDKNKDTSRQATLDRRYSADRFVQDLDDSEWHVAHLKYVEFEGRRDCKGETFEDKARRYRKALKNDGALVEYVSSDPIPYNETDMSEDTCKVNLEEPKGRNTTANASAQSTFTPFTTANVITTDHGRTLDSLVIADALGTNGTDNASLATNASVTPPMSTKETTPINDFKATPAIKKGEDKGKEGEKTDKEKDDKSRRASEYMFSSIEYYDEIPDFDASICPNAVDVIELEIDQLRSYDVECERITEWRSLDG